MPERSVGQAVVDILTSPTRTNQAMMEIGQALKGQEDYASFFRVLFNPGTAKPQDLQTFSQRFGLGEKHWYTRMMVDMAADPLTWLALGSSSISRSFVKHIPNDVEQALVKRGAENVGLGGRALGWLLEQLNLRTYAGSLKEWFPFAERAETVALQRKNEFLRPYLAKRDELFRKMGGIDKVYPHLEAIGRADLLHNLDSLTPEQRRLWEAIKEPMDMAYTKDATAHVPMVKGKPTEYTPMPYISDYLPHVLSSDARLTWRSEDLLAGLSRKTSSKLERLRQAGMDESTVNDLIDVMVDGTMRPSVLFREELIKGGKFSSPFSAYRLRRSMKIGEENINEFVLDPLKLVDDYMHRAANHYALTAPLSGTEASILWNRFVPEQVNLDRLFELNTAHRLAGDPATRDSIAQQIKQHLLPLTDPANHNARMQRSIQEQANEWGIGLSGNVRTPNASAGLNPWFKQLTRARREILDNWWKGMQGSRDAESWFTTKLFRSVFAHATDVLEGNPQFFASLGKVNGKDFGTAMLNEIRKVNNTGDIVKMQQGIVNYMYSTIMGLRPASIVMNLFQLPFSTISDLGFSGFINGVGEVVPRISKTIRMARELTRTGLPWESAFRQASETHLPELVKNGLTTGLRELESGSKHLALGAWGKFQEFVGMPYQVSELLNRGGYFYGMKHHFGKMMRTEPGLFVPEVRDYLKMFPGMDPWDALRMNPQGRAYEGMLDHLAAQATRESQYVSGATQMTKWQQKKGPIGRQFYNYPVGFVNWMVDMGTRGAIDAKAVPIAIGLGKTLKSPGMAVQYLPYARWLAVGAGMSRVSSEMFGTDIGERALGGSLNVNQDSNALLGIIPVPPVPGLLLGGVQSVLSDRKPVGMNLEVPYVGNIPVPRSLVPFGWAINAGGRWVNRTKEGRMIDETGRGMELFDKTHGVLNLMGFFPVDSARDRLKTRQVLEMGRKMRDFRHSAAYGTVTANTQMVAEAQQGYRKYFGENAPPLVVSRQDIKRVKDQMNTTAYDRALKSVPPQVRYMVDPANWQ